MGGIERALTILANYFSSSGHNVIFISCQKGDSFYKLDKTVVLYEFDNNRVAGKIGKIKFYYSLLTFLRKKIKDIKPDCVLSFGDAFNPLVLLALYKTKIPIFISDRTSPEFPFNPLVKFGKKWLYPTASGFIAQTKRAKEFNDLKFENVLNIKIIPNAIKIVKRDITVERKDQVVYVGRLSEEKGVSRLVEAFSRVKNNSWHLVLAGDGPENENLQKLVSDLKLENRVRFLGKVTNVNLLLAESSIFVLPSYVEGFPNALCEAMSAGLPSICFDSIPHEELITDEVNGFVIKNGDLKALGMKIDELILDKAYRNKIGLKAVEINDKLNINKIGKDYLDFICNLQ